MKKMIQLGLGSSVTATLLSIPAAAHPGHGDDADLVFSILYPMGDFENQFLMIVTSVFVLAFVRKMGAGR